MVNYRAGASGCGAIASTLLALVSDLTRLEQRTKSMALIGAAIASSFGLALLIGPILFNLYGAKSIFVFSAVSGLIGLWILFAIIPSPLIHSQNLDLKFQLMDAKRAVSSFSLWRLNISTFILHYFDQRFFALSRYSLTVLIKSKEIIILIIIYCYSWLP